MNRRERIDLAGLVAAWEWEQGGSSSEAAARARCGVEMIQTLSLTDDDLSSARAWEIAKNMGVEDSPDMLDALDDFMDNKGYRAVCDIIEAGGFAALRAVLTPTQADIRKGEA